MKTNNSTAYLLWCCSTFGLCGIHRFYLGKPISGLLYLCTFGVFGIGQLLDLFFIPNIVEQKQLKEQRFINVANTSAIPAPRLDVNILKICRDKKGATLSDCVIETASAPDDVKQMIHILSVDGLLIVDNRDSDGAVIYRPI